MDDLLLQSAILPFAIAAAASGLLRLVAGRVRGRPLAAASIGIAFLAGYILIFGLPDSWPQSVAQKIFAIAALAVALGIALDLSQDDPAVIRSLTVVVLPVALAWLGWPRLLLPDWIDVATLAIAVIAGGIVLTKLYALGPEATESGVKLMIASAALAVVAVIGASASFAQLAGVLAAATAGYLVWNWPVPRFPFAAAAVLGGGVTFVTLCAAAAVFTNAPTPALAMLVPIFFADLAAARMQTGRPRVDQALRPVLVAVMALIPALAAVGLAHLLAAQSY